MEKYSRAGQVTGDNIKRRMHIANGMIKAKSSRLNYVSRNAFEWQQWFF